MRVGPGEHRCGQRNVDLTFAVVEGRLEWVGVAVHPLPGATLRPIKAAHLRDCLALGGLIERAKKHLVRRGLVSGLGGDRDELRQIAERAVGDSWRRLGPEHLALVAEVYARAVASGRRDPTKAVSERWPGTPHSTAAKWVRRARDLELLQPTTKGKASGGIVHHAEARVTFARSSRKPRGFAEGELTKAKKRSPRPPRKGGK